MNTRRFAAALAAAALIFGSSVAVTTSASADEAKPPTMTCSDGHGFRQVAISPVPKNQLVQIINLEDGNVIGQLDQGGSLTLPVDEYDGVKTIQLWGVTSKQGLVQMLSKDCTPELVIDVYTMPGEHFVNGRDWKTTCEKYSQTERCRTEIWATQIKRTGSTFTQTNGWVFNNLTYAPSPRSLWANNPLGHTGSWTATDGRKWRTECDTKITGRNGCRSYVKTEVITATKGGHGALIKEVLNNMVRFS